MVSVSELAIYPLKSCQQRRVSQCEIDTFGLRGDRRWMLVDTQTGDFLSQRSHPIMVRIVCEPTPDGMYLSFEGTEPLHVLVPHQHPVIEATVWGDRCEAADAGDQAAAWCSELLGVNCRLIYMPDTSFRQVSLKYAEKGVRTGFADGFPFLLISEASLADLNQRLDNAVPMLRFRPNIVVSGCEAFAEDNWKRIRIGEIEFAVAKPCVRCVITTIDTATLETSKEPLKTLATYRRTEKGVIFGQNLIHHGTGRLSVGMSVEVLE